MKCHTTVKCNHILLCLFFRFGIFNPAIVYDHLGEIYSALIFGSLIFCIFLYIKVRAYSWTCDLWTLEHFTIYAMPACFADSHAWILKGSCGTIFDWFWFIWQHNNRFLLGQCLKHLFSYVLFIYVFLISTMTN